MTTPTKAEFLAAKVGSTFKFDGHFRKIVSLSPFRANDTGGGLTAGCEYRSIENYWKFLSDLITDLQPPEPEKAAFRTLYVASKVKHAPMWREYRERVRPLRWDIIATWIDEDGPGQTKDRAELAQRCLREAVEADLFVLYAEKGETLKGALIEMGARMAAGKPIRYVGECENWPGGVFTEHPSVTRYESLTRAMGMVEPEKAPEPAPEAKPEPADARRVFADDEGYRWVICQGTIYVFNFRRVWKVAAGALSLDDFLEHTKGNARFPNFRELHGPERDAVLASFDAWRKPTAENLHGKSDIAAELAHRDCRIAELEAENTQLRTMMREAVEEDRKTRREFTDGYFGKKYKSGLSVWAAKMEQALKGMV